MVNNKKNPNIKEIISVIFLFKMEYPMTIGIKGNIHGDKTDATPATNDIRGPISILSSL
jgi:hypothetical protein